MQDISLSEINKWRNYTPEYQTNSVKVPKILPRNTQVKHLQDSTPSPKFLSFLYGAVPRLNERQVDNDAYKKGSQFMKFLEL